MLFAIPVESVIANDGSKSPGVLYRLKDTYFSIAGRKFNDTWAVIVSALRIKLLPTISSPLLTE